MTVMCALRLLTIEQKLADDAVVDSVTAQVHHMPTSGTQSSFQTWRWKLDGHLA